MRARNLLVGVAAVLAGVAIVVALVLVVVGPTRRETARQRATVRLSSRTSSKARSRGGPVLLGRWQAVTPATTVPVETPVQQQVDERLAAGLRSSPSVAVAEAVSLPRPAIEDGWPRLEVASTPGLWATEFVRGLLDIDFARQARAGLGPWLVAEEAPELLPGVPYSVQDKVLYVSVLDAKPAGDAPSPIPLPFAWRADARAGVRWSVGHLAVQLDPQWQQMVSAGWQPRDLRMVGENVSGVLTVTKATSAAIHGFSMTIWLGSAHWHDGYGTVFVSSWKET